MYKIFVAHLALAVFPLSARADRVLIELRDPGSPQAKIEIFNRDEPAADPEGETFRLVVTHTDHRVGQKILSAGVTEQIKSLSYGLGRGDTMIQKVHSGGGCRMGGPDPYTLSVVQTVYAANGTVEASDLTPVMTADYCYAETSLRPVDATMWGEARGLVALVRAVADGI